MNNTWWNAPDNEFDLIIRNAANKQTIFFEEDAWIKMQKILNTIFKKK